MQPPEFIDKTALSASVGYRIMMSHVNPGKNTVATIPKGIEKVPRR